MKYYSNYVTSLKENQIFVFGSNPEGRHGAGTAKIAKDNFGAIYGNGRGLQGKSWALPTKNLSINYLEKSTGIVYKVSGDRSISEEQIVSNIKELYDYAILNPEKEFLIAYTYGGMNLNGYNGDEMANMFLTYGVPENIVFNDTFEIPFSKIINQEIGIK